MTTADRCEGECTGSGDDALNARCGCAVVDVAALRRQITDGHIGVDYAGLFSPYAVFVAPDALRAMASVARAVFEVARFPRYASHVLAGAPALAHIDPGTPGGVLGFDFHLTVEGPRLIEINTNPGGLLLNALLVDRIASCVPKQWMPPLAGAVARELGVDAWMGDLGAQLGRLPQRAAIVDETPDTQFLRPEFELYAAAFRERGVETVIRAPQDLVWRDARLMDAQGPLDAVYNRLTDFGLIAEASAPIAAAYAARSIALCPHPRAHALFADKRALGVLGDARKLESYGVEAATASLLAGAVPETLELTDANREDLWAQRARYFFKPVAGFGSRGSYRGDKLTHRTWDAMRGAAYVAQELVPPSLRIAHGGERFKVDLRCYASATGTILFAARLYQGQTTNMRTPGGGFAAVLAPAGGDGETPGPASVFFT